jgi:hypothetical protein
MEERRGPSQGTDPGATDAGGAPCGNMGGRRGGWPVGHPVGWGLAGGRMGMIGGMGPSWRWEGGMTGGAEPGKEKKGKENRINSNLKLTLQIYSNLIRSNMTFPNPENLK